MLATGSGLTLTSTIFHINKATAGHPKATVVTHTDGGDGDIIVNTSIASDEIALSNGVPVAEIAFD